jgi:hypothetical protein
MHVQVLRHPVAVRVGQGAQRVQVLEPEDIDQKAGRLLKIRNRDAHVVEPSQARDSTMGTRHVPPLSIACRVAGITSALVIGSNITLGKRMRE